MAVVCRLAAVSRLVHFDQKTTVLIVALMLLSTFTMKTSFNVSQGGLRSINGMIVPLPLGVNRVEPPTN